MSHVKDIQKPYFSFLKCPNGSSRPPWKVWLYDMSGFASSPIIHFLFLSPVSTTQHLFLPVNGSKCPLMLRLYRQLCQDTSVIVSVIYWCVSKQSQTPVAKLEVFVLVRIWQCSGTHTPDKINEEDGEPVARRVWHFLFTNGLFIYMEQETFVHSFIRQTVTVGMGHYGWVSTPRPASLTGMNQPIMNKRITLVMALRGQGLGPHWDSADAFWTTSSFGHKTEKRQNCSTSVHS